MLKIDLQREAKLKNKTKQKREKSFRTCISVVNCATDIGNKVKWSDQLEELRPGLPSVKKSPCSKLEREMRRLQRSVYLENSAQ